MTTILTVGTAAATSAEIAIADGSSATFSIVSGPSDSVSFVAIKLVQQAGSQTIGYLRAGTAAERSCNIVGPATVQFVKGVTDAAAGVDQQ